MYKFTARAALTAAALGSGVGLIAGTDDAYAKTVPVKLRVEAAQKPLDPGTIYYTDTAEFRTDTRRACEGSGDTVAVAGATALGVLQSAARARPALRPLAVSDRYEFGLTVCGIGGYFGFLQDYWLYRVNRQAPDSGADVYDLGPGDEVLWYFNQPERGVNVGDELELSAPARVEPGARFAVTVRRYDSGGAPSPAAGATVSGGAEAVVTDERGRAVVHAPASGRLELRATSGPEIPSAPVGVCVNAAGDCNAAPGALILGSSERDGITGTTGDDRIRAGAGDDVVRLRGGGSDRVRCGAGNDRAVVDRRDSVLSGCERVSRRP